MTHCIKCGNLIYKKNILKCENCLAVNFCSINCKTYVSNDNSLYCHNNSCNYFKSLMKYNEELTSFPFKFEKDLNGYSIKRFLKILGIYNRGFWKFKCPLNKDIEEIDEKMKSFESQGYSDYVLIQESRIMSMSPLNIVENILSWTDYYKWRDLSLESPLAGLLHWPLTTYHILSNILSFSENKIFQQCRSNKSISIHFIGVEIELNMLPTFFELENLFGNYSFKLSFIGDKVPASLNGKYYEYRNVKIIICQGLYHECELQEGFSAPDIVIGFNSGLSIFMSWKKTVEILTSLKVPIFFTDYCKYSADLSVDAIQASGIVKCSSDIQILVNPFRSPFREKGNDPK